MLLYDCVSIPFFAFLVLRLFLSNTLQQQRTVFTSLIALGLFYFINKQILKINNSYDIVYNLSNSDTYTRNRVFITRFA